MITEWFVALGTAIGGWFLSWFPDVDSAEKLVVQASDHLFVVMAGAGALGVWFPFDVLAGTFAIVIGLYIAMFLAKIGLKVLSHVPFFGGNG